jgi:hypothetical protein
LPKQRCDAAERSVVAEVRAETGANGSWSETKAGDVTFLRFEQRTKRLNGIRERDADRTLRM